MTVDAVPTKASARVVTKAMLAVRAMPAVLPPPNVPATDSIVSSALAMRSMPPPAVALALLPIAALVSLFRISRSRLAPNPTAPLVAPSAPAIEVIVVELSAVIAMP